MAPETVKKVSHREHVLLRPDSYVGPVSQTKESYWVLDGSRFVKKDVQYSPALLKIFDEILVNAIDRNSLFPKDAKVINVTVDESTITVENSGPLGGIEVLMHQTEQQWNPELTFGHLLTSTNYDDKEDRVVGGRNGYGAKLANIYSSRFEVTIKDGKNKLEYNQTWEDNMKVCNPPKIKKYNRAGSYVSISFTPDWKRFGMNGMDGDMKSIIEKRVYDAAFCTSGCKVSFQGVLLPSMSCSDYMKMYTTSDSHTVSGDRWSVSVACNPDGFQQMSFVNGVCTTNGGTHVDHVVNLITRDIITELAKKANLRPQQVKNTMFILVKSTLVNPTFSSQVKSECTLKYADFGSKFEPPKTFIKHVLKTGIQDEVMAISKFKEMRELKKTDGNQRKARITGIPKLDDANWAGTAKSSRCTLILTEGDSAKTLAISGLSVVGRDSYGVFPLRGKSRNVRDASVAQLTANEEFNNIKKIVGLQQDKVYSTLNELRYGKLMIMADADHDGSHIKGLILNMIHFFWPSLIELGFVVSMVTPIIKATKSKESKWFFTQIAYKAWWDTNPVGWKVKYYKGLGTSTGEEAKSYFNAIDRLTVDFVLDDRASDAMTLAFEKGKTDARKVWLTNASEKASGDIEVKYGDISNLCVSDFIHRDMVHFSLADLRRSIANVMDGFKPSQRKVLFGCFKKNLTGEMKVAQLAAYVSEVSAYHHGEVSLADTIVRMAQDYTGSNNINWLEPCGQFGTRLMGGKDSSQTRYIFTRLMPATRRIFHEDDDAILTYTEDDGKVVEPDFYIPTIPTVLVNGTEGIGTGFSSSVPPFNPDDIRSNIKRILRGDTISSMSPWFKGFKGDIKKDGASWVATGVYTDHVTKITITELPPGKWTDEYKVYLDSLIDKKIISGYKNNSTTDDVNFDIHDYMGTDIVKDFRLSKNIHTTNMHLFHPVQGIKKYTSPEEILVDFVEIRMAAYEKRKNHLIERLEDAAVELEAKSRFIKMVSNGDLIIFNCKKANIEKRLDGMFKRRGGTFDHLLNIKTYMYTAEASVKIASDAESAIKEVEVLKQTGLAQMWLNNI
jgi:DNA topoisomerase-2